MVQVPALILYALVLISAGTVGKCVGRYLGKKLTKAYLAALNEEEYRAVLDLLSRRPE